MTNIFCLGQIIIPLNLSSRIPIHTAPQAAFIQQGRTHIHVYGAANLPFGYLSLKDGRSIGQLLGLVGSCSTQLNKNGFTDSGASLIKLQAFVVPKDNVNMQLRGCVFSRAEDVDRVRSGF